MKPFKLISAARFDVLAALARQHAPGVLAEEVGWYQSEDDTLLAVLLFDTDRQYSAALLGRDLVGRFRWVTQTDFFDTPGPALGAATMFAVAAFAAGRTEYPQGDEGRPVNLFQHVVKPQKLHDRFTLLDTDERFGAARAVVANLMPWIENQDGNFVQQFQSDGFDARIWELYLFMMLREAGYSVSNPTPAPDFLATGPAGQFLVEATTANPVQPGSEPAHVSSAEQADHYLENFVVSRYSGPLLEKLRKRYWKYPHVQGQPLIIAIQDFHNELSMTYSGNALQVYLYGQRIDVDGAGARIVREVKEHVWGAKRFPSGFFLQPDAENISAVMFNGSGTLSKFNRIGIGAGFGSPAVESIHVGRRLDPNDPSGGKSFSTRIVEGYEESWIDGLNVFHNPRSLHPFDESLLPGAVHHRWDGTRYVMRYSSAHLETSVTQTIKRI